MRIKEISVKKLFGTFDHTIPLNMEDRVTVIIGPNGYGKTSLLKLINAVFSYDIETILTIPFEEMRVDFEDSDDGVSHIVVKKDKDDFSKPIKFYRYLKDVEIVDVFPEDSDETSNEVWRKVFSYVSSLKDRKSLKNLDINIISDQTYKQDNIFWKLIEIELQNKLPKIEELIQEYIDRKEQQDDYSQKLMLELIKSEDTLKSIYDLQRPNWLTKLIITIVISNSSAMKNNCI